MTRVLDSPETVARDAERVLCEASYFYDNPGGADLFYGQMGVMRTSMIDGGTLAGHGFVYKNEGEQDSGSYKRRGATVSVLRARDAGYTAVHGMSTGNFGGSLAISAKCADMACTVHLTEDVSPIKEGYSVAAGAAIVKYEFFGEAEAGANAQQNSFFAHPFGFDACVGQTTLGLELVDDCIARELTDNLIIPVSIGGGGHIRGVATAVWRAKQDGRLGPNVHVLGAQTHKNDTLNRALDRLKNGESTTGLYRPGEQVKRVDALAIGEGSLMLDNAALIGDERFVRGITVVSDREVGLAMRALARRGIPAESGAAAAAALAMRLAVRSPALSGVKIGQPPQRWTFVVPISGVNASDESRQLFDVLADSPPEPKRTDGATLRKLIGR